MTRTFGQTTGVESCGRCGGPLSNKDGCGDPACPAKGNKIVQPEPSEIARTLAADLEADATNAPVTTEIHLTITPSKSGRTWNVDTLSDGVHRQSVGAFLFDLVASDLERFVPEYAADPEIRRYIGTMQQAHADVTNAPTAAGEMARIAADYRRLVGVEKRVKALVQHLQGTCDTQRKRMADAKAKGNQANYDAAYFREQAYGDAADLLTCALAGDDSDTAGRGGDDFADVVGGE